MFAHGETVTRQRGAPTTDPYSGEATGLNWTTPALLDIEGCGVADGGSLEPLQDARNAVDSDFDVILPPGSDVLATDRLVVRGLVCEVAGRPFDWRQPMTGWQPGMIVRAKIREG
jgi:hypothetical protein